jgi:RimJ/RimL family protein N-acetyltransferase
MSVPELHTDRLLLRDWRESDAAPFAALNADRDVMRHIGSGLPLEREASDELLGRIRADWRAHGFGLWAAELVADRSLAGFVGLAIPSFLPAVLPAVEVGWRLRRELWGAGLATEGARAALAWAFDELGLREVVAIVAPENAASLRVAEKLGLRSRPDRLDPSSGSRVRVLAGDRTDVFPDDAQSLPVRP